MRNKSKVKNVKNSKLKETKNKRMKVPEDPLRDFPHGTSASADLNPGPTEEPAKVDNSGGGWQPTSAGAAAERQGRTTQEGGAEQTKPVKEKKR